jgi:hypothetical protein
VNEGVQVQLLPAFEGLSTDRAGERVAGVEQSDGQNTMKGSEKGKKCTQRLILIIHF